MPNWSEIGIEINRYQQEHPGENQIDAVRRKYLAALYNKTGRNIIAYYSGWLHGKNPIDTMLNDRDKNAFMLNVNKLDRAKGLDLILHTQGEMWQPPRVLFTTYIPFSVII